MTEKTSTTQTQVPEADSTTNQPVKKKKHWFCRIFIFLMFLLFALLAFLTTETGQHFILRQANKWLDSLHFGHIEGSLQKGLTLTDTHFHTNGVDVNVQQFNVKVGFDCLWHKQICIDQLSVKNPIVRIDSSKLPVSEPKQEENKEAFSLPFAIQTPQLEVENLQLHLDETDIKLDHFSTGITAENTDVHLQPTHIDGLTVLLPKVICAEQPPQAEDKEQGKPIDWQALKTQLSQPLFVKGEAIQLPINVDIPSLEATDWTLLQQTDQASAEPLLHLSTLSLQAQTNKQHITLNHFALMSDKGNVEGKGELELSGSYPLHWFLSADIPELPEQKIPASQIQAEIAGELYDTTTLTIATEGAIHAQLKGSVKLTEPKTPFNLSVTSKDIRYPFMPEKGQSILQLKHSEASLTGDLLDYQLKVGVNAKGMGIPENSQLKVEGRGGLTQFHLENLTLHTLGGTAKALGNLDWQQGLEWQAKVELQQINTQSILPDWAAILSGHLRSSGYVARGTQGQDWQVNLSEMNLDCSLFKKKLTLTGALGASNRTLLNVPQARLIYGENYIDLKGILSDHSNFTALIRAPNLKGLVPNLSATVNGDVYIKGKAFEPTLDIDLIAENVAYEQLRLQHLIAKGNISSEEIIKGNLNIDLKQLVRDDIRLSEAHFAISGDEKNHQVILASKGEPAAADLQLNGSFDRLQQVWKGAISKVSVSSPVGEWKNTQAIQVNYDNKQLVANVTSHCWQNPKVEVCFPHAFKAGKEGNIPFEIRQFDLGMLQTYLDKNSQISGIVNAKGEAAWFTNKAPQVNIELNSNKIAFNQKIDYRQFPLTLTPVKITAKLADNNLTLKTDIAIENNGRLNSDLTIQDIVQRRSLSGNVNIDQIKLKLLSPLLGKGEKVDGNLNAQLTLGGTAYSPLLNGQLSITNIAASAYAMPFIVTDGNLNLRFSGVKSTLVGNIKTKESELVLDGDANWQNLDDWHTRIRAKADKFRVDVPNLAKVDVSPNIEVKATANQLNLTGNIDIPWARINVESLPENAVSMSSDEVIMDNLSSKSQQVVAKELAKNTKGMAIDADVKINIGNDVKLSAYGVKTDLKGQVVARQGSQGLGLYGQINLLNGSYSSFGQDLVIRRGIIDFAGLPAQPLLNIEAIRNPEAMEDQNIVAGVKVTGLADSPDVKIFSEPSLPQDQALSYILTGRSLENSGDASSGNSIGAALIGLGLANSGKVVGNIGKTFGIQDLNVATAGVGDNAKIVVSGSLTPKFKVKYGVGIFAPLTELTLRYRLAPSLYLQWISSINQAVDLLYKFEF